MTIKVIFASPKVGKTYHAVHLIEQQKSRYLDVYSSIDGYKIDGIEGKYHNWLKLTKNEIRTKLSNQAFWEDDAEKRTNAYNDVKKQNEAILAQGGSKKDLLPVPKITSLIVLDEAQRIFPSVGLKPSEIEELMFFLEYHGHYELDVILISQSYKSFHSRVFPLIDQLIQISKVRFKIPFVGTYYKFMVKDTNTFETTGSGLVKFRDEITSKYKSSASGEGLQTPANPIVRFLWLIAIGIAGVGSAYYWLLKPAILDKGDAVREADKKGDSLINMPEFGTKPKKQDDNYQQKQQDIEPSKSIERKYQVDNEITPDNVFFPDKFEYRLNYRKIQLPDDCLFVSYESHNAVCETKYDKEAFRGHNYYCPSKKQKCYLYLTYSDIQSIASLQGLKQEYVHRVVWLQENAPSGIFEPLSSGNESYSSSQSTNYQSGGGNNVKRMPRNH